MLMSYTYLEMDDLEEAEKYAELAMMPSYRERDRLYVINALVASGDIRIRQEKYDLAISRYEDAYQYYKDKLLSNTKEDADIMDAIREKIEEVYASDLPNPAKETIVKGLKKQIDILMAEMSRKK